MGKLNKIGMDSFASWDSVGPHLCYVKTPGLVNKVIFSKKLLYAVSPFGIL